MDSIKPTSVLAHNHSRWEQCRWEKLKCPVFYKLKEVWEGRALEQFTDSPKKDIVIFGVRFKQE